MNKAMCIALSAVVGTGAFGEPIDLNVFTDFEEFIQNTVLGEDITIGVSPESVTLSGPGQFAGTADNLDLYHSGRRAWMVLEQTGADMVFETPAFDVQFYARISTIANGDAIIRAFNLAGDQVGVTETILVGDEFRLIGFVGEIARINIENLASNSPEGMFAIDDLGFSAVPAPATLALAGMSLAFVSRRRR